MSNIDLWPSDIDFDERIVSPISILKEQAALLGQKTQNIVEGEVTSRQDGTSFIHAFRISAPTLGYVFHLFAVIQPIDFYPLSVVELPPFSGELKRDGFGFCLQTAAGFGSPASSVFSDDYKTLRCIQKSRSPLVDVSDRFLPESTPFSTCRKSSRRRRCPNNFHGDSCSQ